MTIDIRTLAVVVGLVSVLQVTALTTQYWLNRGLPGQGWWVLGTAAWTAGFVLNLLRDAPGLGLLAIVGNNLCFIGGLALLHVGVQRFLGQRVRIKALIAFCCAFMLVAFYFTYITNNFAARSLNWEPPQTITARKPPSAIETPKSSAELTATPSARTNTVRVKSSRERVAEILFKSQGNILPPTKNINTTSALILRMAMLITKGSEMASAC